MAELTPEEKLRIYNEEKARLEAQEERIRLQRIKSEREAQERIKREKTKKCPSCAEEIQDEAIKCRYCGASFVKETQFPSQVSNTAADPQGSLYVKCKHCDKMMSIDATTCPYCKKSGGFTYSYILGGGICGVIASIIFAYQASGGEDFFSSALCGICLLNPITWVCMISGMIIGAIVGSIKKQKIKNQR